MTQVLHYSVSEIAPYINWAYFYHAWHTTAEKSPELANDAAAVLAEMDGHIQTHALVGLFTANGDNEDIVLSDGTRLPMLRQQRGSTCFCWADFLPPLGSGQTDMLGLFACSVDEKMEQAHPDDEYRHMLCQTLADRLAEATAECMHKEVRCRLWGYSRDEQLSVEELFHEQYIGCRPAVGYPSLPDQSLNFIIDQLIDIGSIGIRLTESGAMRPHASVSGLLFAHPQACHFAIGPIGIDQIQDYARRRGLPITMVRRFLAANL